MAESDSTLQAQPRALLMSKEKDIRTNLKTTRPPALPKSFARQDNDRSSRHAKEPLKNLGLIGLRGYTFAGMSLYAI